MRQGILFQFAALLAALFKYFTQPAELTFDKPILISCDETINFGDFICQDKFSLLQLHQIEGIGPVILNEIIENREIFFNNPQSIRGIGPKKASQIKSILFLSK